MNAEFQGSVQNLDCGPWTGPWTGLWTGLWTTYSTNKVRCASEKWSEIWWCLSTVPPPVIVISSTSDSEQSDPEMQESVALKLLGMQLETSEIMPQKEQAAHYHLNLSCIRAVFEDFVPSSLLVPYDILPSKFTPCFGDFCALMHLVLINQAAWCTSTCPKLSCVCLWVYSYVLLYNHIHCSVYWLWPKTLAFAVPGRGFRIWAYFLRTWTEVRILPHHKCAL